MTIIKFVVIALAVTLYFSSAFQVVLSASCWESSENGEANVREWSSPAGAHISSRIRTIEMGLRGSMGTRQDGDQLLYSTAIRKVAEKGYQQGFIIGFTTNATIDHYHWEYVGDDGYTAEFQIWNGGLGFKYMTLCFKSQDDHGIYYNVTIYGSFDDQLQAV